MKRGNFLIYQFAIEATSVAIELVIETSPPERGMGSATVRAFGLDAAWSRVPKGIARTAQQSWVQAGRGGTRPRRTRHGRCLGPKGQGWTTGGCARASSIDGVDTRGGNGFRKGIFYGLGKRRDVLEDGSKFGSAWSGGKFVNVLAITVDFNWMFVVASCGRRGCDGRSFPRVGDGDGGSIWANGRRGGKRRGIHDHILVLACRRGGARSSGFRFFDGGKGIVGWVCEPIGTAGVGRFVVKKKIVESKLDGRTRNAELVVIYGGVEPFTIIHAGRTSGSGVKQCRWAKVVIEEVREMERSLVRTGNRGGSDGGDDR